MALCFGDWEVRLASVYFPPKRGRPPPEEEWDALFDHPLPTIAAVDFNCKHPLWNSCVTNQYGRTLYRYVRCSTF